MRKKWKRVAAIALILVVVLGVGSGIYKRSQSLDTTYRGVVSSTNKEAYDFAEQAYAYLQTIGTEYTNRNLFPEEGVENQHDAATEWIVTQLQEAGYTDSQITRDEFDAQMGNTKVTGTNIIASLGPENAKKQIIIGAHYDGDGVGDNGSGVALLLAQAAGLVNEDLDRRVLFIFFDGEEDGELGSAHYVENMSASEKKQTEYMINIDSVAFGDYCNIYSGESKDYIVTKRVVNTEPYTLAMNAAKCIGIHTYTTEDLDGYYAENGTGPAIEENTIYSNPWTFDNPAPANFDYASPSTGGWGDHASFSDAGISYLYLEATNWYAKGDGGENAYTGYFDTGDATIGENGMFMKNRLKSINC